MQAFKTFTGIIAPFNRSNIDTDAIIPKQFLKSIKRTGFGANLFDEWRYHDQGEPLKNDVQRQFKADFILNNAPYDQSEILLARENFGCGSSREHAVWALQDFGFRVVLAPSFGDIFYSNSFKNGFLPIILSSTEIDTLFDAVAAQKGLQATINLAQQSIVTTANEQYSFTIEPNLKNRLLKGLDDIALTLQHADKIKDYEKNKATITPWLFQSDV